LLTGSLIPTVSAVFTNNTGGVLQAVDIVFWGELWRLGLQRYDSLNFEYSTTAGIWTGQAALNFITPDTTGGYGPRNGNLAGNRVFLYSSISGLNLPNGEDIRIRWRDADIPSYDDGLAIDDFQLIPFNGVSLPRIVGTSPADSAKDVTVNAPVKIGFSEPMNPSSLSYTCSPDPGGWTASWNSNNDTVTLSHNNFQYHQVGLGYVFTVTQARDTEGFSIVAGPKPNPFFFTTVYNPNAPPMYITMLNVGQGDCIVIRSPTGKRILVDAGDGGDDFMITNFIKDSIDIGTNTKFLDYTFLSHYHDDHGGGLDEVISRMDSLRVGAYDRGDWHSTGNSTYQNYIDSLASKGWSAKRHPVTMGQTFDIGGSASIQVITFNGKTLSGDSIVPASDDENNHSLGLLLNYADKFKMVMCGDISKNIERILSPDLGGRVSVLKANHHGSNDANGLKWVTDLNPMLTMIPVGDGNSYGHVHIGARDSLLADPKTSKAAGDSNRLYRTELGSGAPCVAGRDTAMNQNIHIEVTPANPTYGFKVLNDGSTYPWLGGTPLSVYLTSFTALTGKEGVQLRWRTESEENTYLWEIERSGSPNSGYSRIVSIPGHGTTSQPHDYEFTDNQELTAGTYWYRLCEVELSGKRNYYGPVSVDFSPGGVWEFTLGMARPNPFNRITSISYQLTKAGAASLKLYNVLGQEVRSLADGEHSAGTHRVSWDGRDDQGRRVSSGVYFYRLESGENQASGKLLFVR
jgi:beta-lactamase superfamily II metal-dependent hydrolase